MENIFRLILIVVLMCGPIVLIAKILQWILQFSIGGGLGRVMGGIMGQAEGKMGGGLKQYTQKRRGETAFGLSRQLRGQDRSQRRVAGGVSTLQGGWRAQKIRGAREKLSGVRGLGGLSQQDQRIQQQLMSYQVEDETKSLQNFNTQHLQALAASKGNTSQAVRYLKDRGINVKETDINATATALTSVGKMRQIESGNTSTLQAIGNVAASRGELLGDSGATVRDPESGDLETAQDGFAGVFANAAAQSGSNVNIATAKGIGASWGIQAKQAGQGSQTGPANIRSMAKLSGSDAKPLINSWAQQLEADQRILNDLNTRLATATDPDQITELRGKFSRAQDAYQSRRGAIVSHLAEAVNASRAGGGDFDPRVLFAAMDSISTNPDVIDRGGGQFGSLQGEVNAKAAELERKTVVTT